MFFGVLLEKTKPVTKINIEITYNVISDVSEVLLNKIGVGGSIIVLEAVGEVSAENFVVC